jgi:hypothetical protein
MQTQGLVTRRIRHEVLVLHAAFRYGMTHWRLTGEKMKQYRANKSDFRGKMIHNFRTPAFYDLLLSITMKIISLLFPTWLLLASHPVITAVRAEVRNRSTPVCKLTPSVCVVRQQQGVWVNEFHYDNTGTDVGEFIEFGHTIPLNGVRLFYQKNPAPTDTTIPAAAVVDLSGFVPSSTVDGISYTVVSLPIPGGLAALSNGPNGFLVSVNGAYGTTLSYEGPLVAQLESSVDVGVFEDETTPIGYSLQKCPDVNLWVGPRNNTRGGPNQKCLTSSPTKQPSAMPSHRPSNTPSVRPSFSPTKQPSAMPSFPPTNTPSHMPTSDPTVAPSQAPSVTPSASPTRLCPFQWNIYHSRSNKKVYTIVDGGTIRNPPPCRFINIEAVPLCDIDPEEDDVILELYQGTTLLEQRAAFASPYFLFGHQGADVLDGSILAGTYSIRAIVNGGVSPFTTFTLGGKCGK